LQGCGLALLPLAMSVARDHLDPERAKSTLATLSVTAIVGVGLGYPLTGVIAEHFNFHVAFWSTAVLGVIAMGLCTLVVPTSGHRPRQPFDLAGAVLLGPGLGGLLIGISEGGAWGWGSPKVIAIFLLSLAVIAGWIWYELRATTPLVDLRLMRHRPVATANITGLLAGVGMYMLLSMIIRYVQTPRNTGYGLGASVVVAGLVVVPWSGASFLSSKLVTYVSRWVSADRILPFSAVGFAVSLILFATLRDQLWEIYLEMAVGGIGIGCLFSVMPRMILSAVPAGQTGSALALNQVVRAIGLSIGSALAATILTAHTAPHEEFPANAGYTMGAVVALGLCVLTAVVGWGLSARMAQTDRTARTVFNPEQALLIEQNVGAAIAGLLTLEDDEPPITAPGKRTASS
jgi:predicted MFS family arabinose efflux permease